MLDDREIKAIIDRVKGRVAAAENAERRGADARRNRRARRRCFNPR